VIGVPFDNNDLSCLGIITEVIANLVARHDPSLTKFTATYQATEPLFEAPSRALVPSLSCTRWQDVRVQSFLGDRGHAR
jgi:hypothetical protein